jgi:hypothetical protein
MIHTLTLVCVLLGSERGEGGPAVLASADRASYESARKKAGHDANAHVRLALWCEAHGLDAERVKHLALAILYDPSHALARGLLGLVAHRGQWGPPEVVGAQIQADPAYRAVTREYLERRAKAPNRPDAQLRLADWCEENGLTAQARIHYASALQLDPAREAAWRHLGYKKLGRRWIKPDVVAAEKAEAELQKRADQKWKSKLKLLRDGLESKQLDRQAQARDELRAVTDPRAVRMIWAVFLRGSAASQLAAIQMLGQIDSPAASGSLAALAVCWPGAEVRTRAISSLARRDPRDVVGPMIGLVRKPFKYHVRPVGGPGSAGVLFVEGERFNIERIYQSMPLNPWSIPSRLFDPSVQLALANQEQLAIAGADPRTPRAGAISTGRAIPDDAADGLFVPSVFGSPLMNLGIDAVAFLAELAATTASSDADKGLADRLRQIADSNRSLQQNLVRDVQAIEAANFQINRLNERVLPVLTRITGQEFGAEPEKWKGWWIDRLGYAFQAALSQPNPTFTDVVYAGPISSSCFGAGTLVSTVDGPRKIEVIQVGDRVLSQNPTTGQLTFQPVLAVHASRPAPTVRIHTGDDQVVATGIHRFWKPGIGWTMARDLKPGDRLRVVGATAEVRAIEPDASQPVYNLDVADNRCFFVGTKGLLVHDFSFVQPVASPFDQLESSRA